MSEPESPSIDEILLDFLCWLGQHKPGILRATTTDGHMTFGMDATQGPDLIKQYWDSYQ